MNRLLSLLFITVAYGVVIYLGTLAGVELLPCILAAFLVDVSLGLAGHFLAKEGF